MKLNVIIIFYSTYFFNCVSAQMNTSMKEISELNNHYSIDTMEFKSKDISIIYTLTKTNNIKYNFFGKGDSILNNDLNKISKLYLTNKFFVTDTISTIPIDNIIIDDTKELIIGLSRSQISPYHLVIYNFNGELLYKKVILPFELEIDSIGYMQFKDSFPEFFDYVIRQKQILQVNDLYYIDLGYWHFLSETKKQKIKESGWFKISHYFPNLLPECFDCTSSFELSKYTNFYSQTDPFYDFELKNGKPISIILNDEFGGKVKIPINVELKTKGY
jgi:hypothetical protein